MKVYITYCAHAEEEDFIEISTPLQDAIDDAARSSKPVVFIYEYAGFRERVRSDLNLRVDILEREKALMALSLEWTRLAQCLHTS